MATMRKTVIPNSTRIRVSVIILKNMGAQIGNNATGAQIVHRDLLVRKARLARGVQLGHKEFLESEVR